jgi:hypothetical protein
MKRILAFLLRVLIIILVIFTLFLAYPELEGLPNVTLDIELLITVVLYVSFSFWIALADKEMKGWEKRLLPVGMFLGSLLFLLLSYGLYFDWTNYGAVQGANNLLVGGECMIIIAAILFAAIPVFILILKREAVVTWFDRWRENSP